MSLSMLACGAAPDSADTDGGSTGSVTGPPSTSTTAGTTASTTATTASSGMTTGDADTGASASSASTTADASDDGSSSGGGVSPGCGNASAATGETARNVMIAGVDRSYLVDAPASIDPSAPLSLVFVFHGNGGSGQGIQGMGLQWVDGAQDQAVFVFPDGLPYMDFGVGWDGVCEEYDMEFFDTMVATLSSEYCIDADRIFAAGFSWGGDMCQALACCRGEVVRAIAPASGPEFYPSQYPAACPDTERPAFRMTYATNDAYPPQMFADTIAYYRDEHGCQLEPAATDPAPCVAYQGCDEPVIACEYEGLGHAWPADWADQTWAFFTSMP
jgi:polyhydroxybutyrate depolymerase